MKQSTFNFVMRLAYISTTILAILVFMVFTSCSSNTEPKHKKFVGYFNEDSTLYQYEEGKFLPIEVVKTIGEWTEFKIIDENHILFDRHYVHESKYGIYDVGGGNTLYQVQDNIFVLDTLGDNEDILWLYHVSPDTHVFLKGFFLSPDTFIDIDATIEGYAVWDLNRVHIIRFEDRNRYKLGLEQLTFGFLAYTSLLHHMQQAFF